MKTSKGTTRADGNRSFENLTPGLWRSGHRGPPLPISHPIPRLSPPLRTRWRLEQINQFVQSRLAAMGLCAAIAWLCAACTVVSYQNSSGERFSRAAIGTASALTALEVETATNGLRRISLRGYRSDSADALQVVTEAAVRAAARP